MRNHILGQRDSSEMTKEFAIVISQFTLPWRERQKTKRFSSSSLNFNPRPREGSDNQQDWLKPEMPYFNPRPREGSDVFLQSVVVVLQISIHAPVKGATLPIIANFLSCFDFNPRPREGSDSNQKSSFKRYVLFQSTPPWRERRSCSYRYLIAINFNPRPREGSDSSNFCCFFLNYNFNPRPREGSDGTQCDQGWACRCISIHAPVKGATRWLLVVCLLIIYFNPRSREGSDQTIVFFVFVWTYFNPRSREGSDELCSI